MERLIERDTGNANHMFLKQPRLITICRLQGQNFHSVRWGIGSGAFWGISSEEEKFKAHLKTNFETSIVKC